MLKLESTSILQYHPYENVLSGSFLVIWGTFTLALEMTGFAKFGNYWVHWKCLF